SFLRSLLQPRHHALVEGRDAIDHRLPSPTRLGRRALVALLVLLLGVALDEPHVDLLGGARLVVPVTPGVPADTHHERVAQELPDLRAVVPGPELLVGRDPFLVDERSRSPLVAPAGDPGAHAELADVHRPV